LSNLCLDGKIFQAALEETATQLNVKRENLNQINVFPVPDGDTGNNLLATLESALQETENSNSTGLAEVTAAAFRGARNGSCGNSGAIFAQYLKGWAAAFSGLEKAGARQLALAMAQGAKKAYNTVVNPIEGTILTVAREAAEAAVEESATGNLAKTMLAAYRQARKSLLQTSRAMSSLCNHNVIDAGGWGLLIFFYAILKVMGIQDGEAEFAFKPKMYFFQNRERFQFINPYDMEFVVSAAADSESEIRASLQELGSDLITQSNQGTCHVHIHTTNPLTVIERVVSLAPLSDIIIRDMRSQHNIRHGLTEGDKNYTTLVFGKSPGFLAMFAMAGAEMAISVNAVKKKIRLLEEYDLKSTLLLSLEEFTLPLPNISAVVVQEEVRILAALVSLYSLEKPSFEAVRNAAEYPRVARIVRKNNHFETYIKEVLFASGDYEESVAGAVSILEPHKGEVLTIFYDKVSSRAALEEYQTILLKEFPVLESIEIYYGGQDDSLILSLE